MSLKLIRYNYEERDIARLLVLLSWSGTVTIQSATKLATEFLTKKIKSLGITSLVPIIVCKIQAHCQLMMRPDGSQLYIIFGLLTNGSSKLTWGLTRQLVGCYYIYIYIEVENDLQNQLQLELNRKGKGCAINVNIAKGSVYLRLATKEAGGEDAWQILFDTTKASTTIITSWQGYVCFKSIC